MLQPNDFRRSTWHQLTNCSIASAILCLFTLANTNPGSADEFWSQFRGPDGSGVSVSSDVTTEVDPAKNSVWRTETDGAGWSSPVTDGETLWMTGARITAATPEQKKAALTGISLAQMKDVAGKVELIAIVLDAESGKRVRTVELGVVDSPKPIHPMNGYASPTPVIAGESVIVHFGQYGTWCLNKASGDVLWQRQIVIDDSVGPGSSPVVCRGNVILTCDGMDEQFIEALSLETGESVWKTSRPTIDAANGEQRKAYSTPLIIDVDGQTQVVIPGSQWCAAYDPVAGRELWRVEHGEGFSVTPMPTLVDGKIIFSTGFMKPDLVAVDPSGSGDVTDSHIVWRSSRGGPRMSSMISDGERLYSVSDDGILTALSVADGEMIYRERIGGKYSASPIRVGNRILIADHDGNVIVFETGDQFLPIATYELGEQIMASPIPLGDDLIVRTIKAVYRFSSPGN